MSKTSYATPFAIIHVHNANRTPLRSVYQKKKAESSGQPPLVMAQENKNSFKTGDPANSGLSKTQLKVSQSIYY